MLKSFLHWTLILATLGVAQTVQSQNGQTEKQAETVKVAEAVTGIRFEVDGVALGDDMETVLAKWGLELRDIQEINDYIYDANDFHDVPANKRKQVEAEYNLLVPKKYVLRQDTMKGNTLYKATFNHKKILVAFYVGKTDKESYDLQELYKMVIDKYGTDFGDGIGNMPGESSNSMKITYYFDDLSLTIKAGQHSGKPPLYYVARTPKWYEAFKKETEKIATELKASLAKKYVEAKEASDIQF